MIHVDPSTGGWLLVHEELTRLARSRAAHDWEEGCWLLRAARQHVHRKLGFGSLVEYVERLFGYKPRTTEEKLRVAAALEGLPELAENLKAGRLSWSAVRELTRVAKPETEQAWLDAARGKTIRQIERLVSGRIPGDTPDTPVRPEHVRCTVAFELRAETLALFREAVAKLCRDAGHALDDDTTIMMMARNVLGGPADAGRASYQIALDVCAECGRASQLGKGEAMPVASEVLEMASCDAQYVGSVAADAHAGAARVRATQEVPKAIRRWVFRRDEQRCVVPGCKNGVFLDLHHIRPRSEGGVHDPDTMVVLCAAHHLAQHRGRLSIEGRVSTGLSFRHADGSAYGSVEAPRRADVHARVFSALRSMGFRETEARRALAELRTRSDLVGAGLEALLRAALGVLGRGR